jgi:hypothetical protein
LPFSAGFSDCIVKARRLTKSAQYRLAASPQIGAACVLGLDSV